MATLPGLPMFGHGQIEGYSEKYGMEFRRAYWDEKPDPYLVDRHNREIFPLLHRRSLFSGVENFLLYDFFTPQGSVNEDVFAYSNGIDNVRALVVYHNKFADTAGWVRSSVGFLDKGSHQVIQRSLKEGLGLTGKEGHYVIFRDESHHLEYIRPSKELAEQGLFVQLGAYKYHVFLDFREVADDGYASYCRLYEYLNGRGVPSIDEALKELLLQPIQNPFWQIANPGYFGYLYSIRVRDAAAALPDHILPECEQKLMTLLHGIESLHGAQSGKEAVVKEIQNKLQDILWLNAYDTRHSLPEGKTTQKALKFLKSGLDKEDNYLALFGWLFTHNLGKLSAAAEYEEVSESWLEEWQFTRILANVYQQMGLSESKAWKLVGTVKTLIYLQRWYEQDGSKPTAQMLAKWLGAANIQQFLNINRYQDVLWFNQESFDNLLWWLTVLAMLDLSGSENTNATQVYESLLGVNQVIDALRKAEVASGFQVQKLINN
jgi:hypothetical protein